MQSGFAEGQVVGNRDARQGTFTDFRAKKAARFDSRIGLGGSATAESAVNVTPTLSLTGVSQFGVRMRGAASSGATTEFNQFSAEGVTQAAAFTVPVVRGYYAKNVTKGAGSTITTQIGVDVEDLTSGTNNYAYRGQVSFGANKFNLRMDGTAINYFAANLLLGTLTDGMTAGGSLAVAQDFAHRGTKVGFYNTAPIVKPAVAGNKATVSPTANLLFALNSLGIITDNTTYTPVALPAAATDPATTMALVNAIRTLLINAAMAT